MSAPLVRPLAKMSAYFESIDSFVTLDPAKAWRADDAVVRERPDLFESPVEQASAAPGEKRSTRRPAS